MQQCHLESAFDVPDVIADEVDELNASLNEALWISEEHSCAPNLRRMYVLPAQLLRPSARDLTANGRAQTGRYLRPTARLAIGRGETVLVVAASIVVTSPVIFNPVGFDSYQLPKLLVQAVALIVALTAILVTQGPPIHRALVPLGALLLALGASTLSSNAPWVSFVGTSSRRFGLVGWFTLGGAFIVGLGCATTDRRRRLLMVLLMSSSVVSAYALAQRLGIAA